MFSKKLLLCLLLISLVLFSSCTNSKKYLETASELEHAGSRLEANKELIKALRGTRDKDKKVELQVRIASNYSLAQKYSDAAEYYKKAIEGYNSMRQSAPYEELANVYIKSGDINSAIALLSELGNVKPTDYLVHQAKIARSLAAYFNSQKSYEKSLFYYKEYLKFAKTLNNPVLIQDAENRINYLENRGKKK